MGLDLKRYTDYLVQWGAHEVPHSDTPFLAHLIGVCRDLEAVGCGEAVCLAGLFHSIYGTEMFTRFAVPLDRRSELRELIGDEAEHLVYLNCAMERPTFDANLDRDGDYRMRDRFEGIEIELSAADFENLCWIQFIDWMEQVPRSHGWDYRREPLHRMAERLGPKALEVHQRTYALEPVSR